jgi:hypothetical protein
MTFPTICSSKPLPPYFLTPVSSRT